MIRLMEDATAALIRFLGPTVGGLMNATLINAPEIITGFFALKSEAEGNRSENKTEETGWVRNQALTNFTVINVLQAGFVRWGERCQSQRKKRQRKPHDLLQHQSG